MTKSTITRERLEKIKSWRETYGAGSNVMLPAEEAEELARMALAAMDSDPVVYMWDSKRNDIDVPGFYFPEHLFFAESNVKQWGGEIIPLYRHAQPAPAVPDDYFSSLVAAARLRAGKAMRKYPQPNYVLNKVAEESGEVIKAVIHYTEGREEWASVEGELIDNLAMLIRLVIEGDQVIGFTPPDACRAAMLQELQKSAGVSNNCRSNKNVQDMQDESRCGIKSAPPLDLLPKNTESRCSNSPVIPDGYVMVPKEMTDEIGEAIAMQANCCGGIALDIYDAMLAAAPQEVK